MNLQIRHARQQDADAIVGILNPIIDAGVYTVLDTPFTPDAERQFIRDFPTRGVFHLAVNPVDERVVGFQTLEPFAQYTHAFDHVGVIGTYVDLQCRRQGVARQLFQAMFLAASQKGFEKIFAFVRADNPAALQTYVCHGFRTIGTAHKHAKVGGRYIDEVMIERQLGRPEFPE